MKRILTPFIALALAVTVSPATAGDVKWQLPTKPFVADAVMTGPGGQQIGIKMTYTDTKFRMDMSNKGQSMAMIIDRPAKKVTMLMINRKMFMTMPMKADMDVYKMMQDDAVNRKITKVGEETVNGQKTTKYRYAGKNSKGQYGEGHIWVTDDWIWMKIVGTQEKNGKKTAFNWETKKLAIGPVDAAAFAVPDGFKDMMAAMKKKQQQ